LIFLDVGLPDGSGLELLKDLRASAATAHVPVVILSVDDRREPSITAGACQHLVKPVARDALAAAAVQFARLDAVSRGDGRAPIAALGRAIR
jgi:two-component system catabolic regulation response regulator CreB